MIINSQSEELFVEPKGSFGPRVLAALAALVITALVLVGYAYLRKRHAQSTNSGTPGATLAMERKGPPKAMIFVDDALLRGGNTILGGTVRNTSGEKLGELAVELELKRRKDGVAERRLVALEPSQLDPQQEGSYSLTLKANDYGSARLVALKAGPPSASLAYTVAQGQKRPLERIESKTVMVDKRSSKRSEFFNSPENPARVP
jgi:hypothetical protein